MGHLRSESIVNQSTSIPVTSQPLSASKFNFFGNVHIDRGSVVITPSQSFRVEVSSVAAVTSSGKYHIDYLTGLITSFDAPSDDLSIQYSFLRTPLIPVASPVIVRAIHSPEFSKVMFTQILQGDGTYENGPPTIKGASIINELLSVTAQYWGP